MFDDLIEKLKAKLPENIREKIFKESDDEYEDDDFDESTGDHDVSEIMNESTETNLEASDDEDDEEYEDDEEELSEEELKKMKRSRMIKAFVGMVVAFIFLDELLLKEEPAPAPTVTKKKRVKRKKPRKKVVKKAPIKKVAAPIAEKPVPKPTPKPIAQPEPVAPKVEDVVVEQKVAEIETPQVQDDINLDGVGIAAEVETTSNEKSIDDQLSKIVEKVAVEAKKEEDLVYVSAPEYENLGRGLVYNCVGKHWACVDKIAYIKCDKNQKWNKNSKKKMECITSEIYATEDDCRKIQIHNINTITETKFCNK